MFQNVLDQLEKERQANMLAKKEQAKQEKINQQKQQLVQQKANQEFAKKIKAFGVAKESYQKKDKQFAKMIIELSFNPQEMLSLVMKLVEESKQLLKTDFNVIAAFYNHDYSRAKGFQVWVIGNQFMYGRYIMIEKLSNATVGMIDMKNNLQDVADSE